MNFCDSGDKMIKHDMGRSMHLKWTVEKAWQPAPQYDCTYHKLHKIRCLTIVTLSQLMRLWYLSHRRPAKAQASLRVHAVLLEPSLFAHMNYGSRRRVRPKIRRIAPLDGCACGFEEWVYGGRKVPKSLWVGSPYVFGQTGLGRQCI